MQFTPHETRCLQSIGQTEVGRELVAILKRAKNHYSDVATLDMSRDTNAQVEGRTIFRELINDLTKEIETKTRSVKAKDHDDYT